MIATVPAQRRPLHRTIALNLALALISALIGGPTLLWLSGPGMTAPMWPSAGIAFAFIFQWGPQMVPGVLLGSLLAYLPVLSGGGLPLWSACAAGLGVAAGAAVQALVGAEWMRRVLGSHPTLTSVGSILRFVLLPGPCTCVVGSFLAMRSLVMVGALPHGQASLSWLIGWVGDSIGVIVFAPLTLMLLPGQADAWQGRRWKLAIPSLLVTALTIALFLQSVDLEKRQNQLQLEQLANQAKSALERNLVRHKEALEGIRSLFDAIGYVSRQEFARFTLNSLQRIDGLEALSWNPLIRSEQLEAFERHQREEEGLPNYRIVEKSLDGALHPVRPRASHVLVAYIEPLEQHRLALGFDIQSNAARAMAIELALRSGVAQATAPVTLIQEDGTQKGILLLLPVFEAADPDASDAPPLHRKLRGFTVGVYRLGNLLIDTFNGYSWEALTMRLVDVTPSEDPVELARYPTTMPYGNDPVALEILPVVRRSLVFAGRLWELEVRAKASFLTPLGPATAPPILLRGLFLSGLLEAFLLLVSGLERQQKRDLERKLRTSLTAAAVSHEIKQPLTTMLLHAATIERILMDDHPVVSRKDLLAAVRGMSSDARRVSITIEKIRDVLGNVESNLTPINITVPIQAALLLAKADLALQRIRVETTGLEQDQHVLGDREQLQLVILNLLRNSIEATGSGGTVRISLKRSTHWVDLVVADDGPGFAPEPVDLDRLLMASTKRQGTGIGLYVVRCAMENHKGKLEVGRSSLGGAEVRLRFPPLPSPAWPASPSQFLTGG